MNLLIVDDDVIEVDELLRNMPWMEWGIEKTYHAYNIGDAKKLICEKKIQILLCDIEMPMGSGLDLIQWIKESKYKKIEVVVLSCHSEFMYAQRAIRLGCINYLSKPIEMNSLMEAILQAEENVTRTEREEQFFGNETYFWEDVLTKEISSERSLQKIQKLHGWEQSFRTYIPVLLSIKHIDSPQNINMSLAAFIAGNVAGELMQSCSAVIAIVRYNIIEIIVPGVMADKIHTQLEKVEEYLLRRCYIYSNGYIGNAKEPFCAASEMHRLMLFDRDCVEAQKVFETDELSIHPDSNGKGIPDQCFGSMVESAFRENKFTELYSDLKRLFSSLKTNEISRKMLIDYDNHLRYEIKRCECQSQSFHHILEQYENENNKEVLSIVQFLSFYSGLLERYEATAGETGSLGHEEVVEKVKEYISLNIDRIVSREELAEYVCMNVDYLNRVFKGATGKSLMKYINDEKVEMCKQLLQETSLTVSEVSEMVGFSNYSYFATFFKKNVGISPSTYRLDYEKQN